MTFNKEKYFEIIDFIHKNTKKTVKIVAVSKNHAQESVIEAIKCGVLIFGENRVQEALSKFSEIKRGNKEIELHLTGPLQSNKVKQALEIFDVFQTLDREKLAKEFIKYPNIVKNKKFFIQINTGKEKNKSGILPEDADKFINYCKTEIKLPIIGLMCIPPINDSPSYHFNILKKISNENDLEHLSMGMSGDYEEAVFAGATHIRVGTKLFGKRNDL